MSNYNLWEEFFLDKINLGWSCFFEQEAKKDYFFPLLKKIRLDYDFFDCYPNLERVFYLFREISPDQIKVIILGQDPYYTPGVADGLAFSTQKRGYIPGSLKNIFLELKEDIGCDIPKEGSLFPWIKEGVFLLNVALTVIGGKPLSHVSIWEPFIFSLVNFLKLYKKELIWVFWGNNSRKVRIACGIAMTDSVVSSHPSPLSARYGFFSSRPFSRINRMLIERKILPIDWARILIS